MSREVSMKTLSIAVVSVMACGCGESPTTSLRLDIVASPSLAIDGLTVKMNETRHEEPMSDSLLVLVPDDWAGIAQRIDIEGTSQGDVVAVGATVVTPIVGSEVTGSVTLVDARCEQVCDVDAMQCAGDGVATCELGDNGCPRWSAPIACPAESPFCTNGTCADTCGDECSIVDRADLILPMGAGTLVGLSTGTSFGTPAPWHAQTETLRVGDVNGDGKGDLIVDSFPETFVALSTGTSFGAFSVWANDVLLQPEVGDVNGDGRDDLVCVTNVGTKVSLSTGASFFPATTWLGFGGADTDWDVGDVNGDGLADLALVAEDYHLYVALSTGTGFAPRTNWHDVGITGQSIGDVNGDGMADVVWPLPGADTYVALSTGSDFGDGQEWSFAPSVKEQVVGDVNGDGMADLVVPKVAGTYVALSTGTSFGVLSLWTTATSTKLVVGNVDGN
jgi:hypothetical protein